MRLRDAATTSKTSAAIQAAWVVPRWLDRICSPVRWCSFLCVSWAMEAAGVGSLYETPGDQGIISHVAGDISEERKVLVFIQRTGLSDAVRECLFLSSLPLRPSDHVQITQRTRSFTLVLGIFSSCAHVLSVETLHPPPVGRRGGGAV